MDPGPECHAHAHAHAHAHTHTHTQHSSRLRPLVTSPGPLLTARFPQPERRNLDTLRENMLYLALPHRPPTPTGGALLALGIRERHRCGQRGRRAKQLAHLACVAKRGEISAFWTAPLARLQGCTAGPKAAALL